MANCLPEPLVASKGRALICEGTAFRATQENGGCRFTRSCQGNRPGIGLMRSNRVRARTIPKGLRPPAQGCEERATLGKRRSKMTTATRLRPCLAGHVQSQTYFSSQLLYPFCLRDGAPESREQMHVVFHSPGEDGRTIELFRDTAEIRVERVARGFVAQKRTTVFGGEDEMNVNGGKGLWHVERMVTRGVVRQR